MGRAVRLHGADAQKISEGHKMREKANEAEEIRKCLSCKRRTVFEKAGA